MESRLRRLGALPWILLAALAIRLVLFTGVQGGDDTHYYVSAVQVMRGEPLAAGDLLQTRVGYVVPMGLLFSIFGPTTASLLAPALAASLLLVALAWWLGRHLCSEAVGAIAAGAVALLPIDIFHATTATTDVPMALWIGLGVCLARSAIDGPSGPGSHARAVLASACFGIAWATRESAPMFIAPALPLLIRRPFRKELISGAAALGVAGGLYLISFAVVRGDPLHPMHVARAALAAQDKPEEGLLRRLLTLPSLCANPLDPLFPYTGGIFAVSAAGAVYALAKDRARLGGVAAWWLGSALILILLPLSIFPYRPAIFIVPRFYAMLALPGAVLAAAFLREAAAVRFPRAAAAGGIAVGLLSLACAVRVHADAVARRVGPDWAYEQLRNRPGGEVLTDPRTATLLRVRTSDSPPWKLRVARRGEPIPPSGTVLLYSSRQAVTSRLYNDFDPPDWWWETRALPADLLAEQRVPAPRSLRGSRGPEEHTAIWKIR